MRAANVEQNQNSLSLHVPLEEVADLEMDIEQIAFRNFLMLKALNMNVSQFGRATGWIGRIVFGCIGTGIEGEEEEASEIGYQITSLPAKLVGLVTAPIRGFYLCHTRNLVYTSSQVAEVCRTLQQLRVHSSEENLQIFRKKMDQVIRAYNQPVFATSDSSNILIVSAMSQMPDAELVKNVHDYLAAREAPISLWRTEEHLKNQGKRLFNIIMHEFLDFVLQHDS